MLRRLLMVITLAALAVAVSGDGRADACTGLPEDCLVAGSLTVHVPAYRPERPSDPEPPGPFENAWTDALASQALPGDTTVICNTLAGRPGGFAPPGTPAETEFLYSATGLLTYPPESQARGYTGAIGPAELSTV